MARRRSRGSRGRRRGLSRSLSRWVLVVGVAGLGLACLATAIPVLLLRAFPPPTTAFMLESRRADPATGRPCAQVAYRWVDWASISPQLPLAVVLAEDQRFLQHRGFDVDSIADAIEERLDTGRVRGASTITQQLAKNLFLWPTQSFLRKGIEAWFALWLEATWSKRRILEVYVNVAQFGPCVFGVGAASEHYFDGTPAELTPEQAALLAAVLPDPYRMRAHAPGPFAEERAAEILALMQRHAQLARQL